MYVETTSLPLCHMEGRVTVYFPNTNICNEHKSTHIAHMVQFKFIAVESISIYLSVTYLLDVLAACPVFTQILSITVKI